MDTKIGTVTITVGEYDKMKKIIEKQKKEIKHMKIGGYIIKSIYSGGFYPVTNYEFIGNSKGIDIIKKSGKDEVFKEILLIENKFNELKKENEKLQKKLNKKPWYQF